MRLAAPRCLSSIRSSSCSRRRPRTLTRSSPASGPEVWVEDKYDGIRCQLHKLGRDVRLYSRDLHDISGGYPEIVEGARDLPWDGILDGEILAWREGVVLPFIALQARLGRKAPSAAIRAEIPVIYVAYDVLGLGPGGAAPVVPLLDQPLRERRARLEALDLPLAGRVDGSPARTCGRGRRRRARSGVPRRARPAQRGPDGEGPGQPTTRQVGAGSAGSR